MIKNNASEVLVLREVVKPIPGDNEVLVRIFAASVNAGDYRSMRLGIIPKRKIFGSAIAGCIEATGKSVRKLSVGDEVFADISSCGSGGFAEYVIVPERLLALKPKEVSFGVAAAIPIAAVTALQAMRNKGNIQQGKKVLIYGAGGGVGTFAVQLSKYFGSEVTAVCSEKNVQLVKDLGADHVINYNEQDFTKDGKRYDLVIAVNGNNTLTSYKHVLTQRGVCVVVGGALSHLIKTILLGALMSLGGKKMTFLSAKPNTEDLEFIIKLVQEGKIKPVIDRQYSLHETAEAMQYLGEGHAMGKLVINVVHSTQPI